MRFRSPGHMPLRPVRNVSLFAIALIVTSLFVSFRIRSEYIIGANEAKRLPKNVKADVIFAGSSLVGHMIDPDVFDATLKNRDMPLRSFNLGRGGADAHETQFRIRDYFRRYEPPQFVIIECQDFPTYEEAGRARAFQDKFIGWHDFRQTALAIRFSQTFELHVLAASLNIFPVGRWKDFSRVSSEYGHPSDDGYWSVERLENEDGRYNHVFRRQRDELLNMKNYADEILRRGESVRDCDPQSVDDSRLEPIRYLCEEVRALGAVPVFLAAPSFWHDPALPRAIQARGIAKVILVDDPAEYPVFFEREARQDWLHLNDQSARDYSRVVAEEFHALTHGSAR